MLLNFGMAKAWECEYGEAKAWVKLYGEKEWKEAIVKGITLKVKEPFEIKIFIRTKIDCWVAFELYEPGKTRAYEAIKGGELERFYNTQDLPANWTNTYYFKVRPTGNWTRGTAPLNLFVQFTKSMEDYKTIHKTVIYAYISPEKWEVKKEIPGFEAIFIILLLLFLGYKNE